ncbi:hypothetical protein ACKVWM_003278 [Pyricularia oryzae]
MMMMAIAAQGREDPARNCVDHSLSPVCRTMIAGICRQFEVTSDRLAAVVKSTQQVDGICTCTDDYLVAVAQAAQHLGLLTPGVKPYTISTNKFLTRMFSGRNAGTTFSVRSLAVLYDELAGHVIKEPLTHPMVCKPWTRRGSAGVFRADDANELRDAVARILASAAVVPAAWWSSQVVDDFPLPADYTSSATFNERYEALIHAPSGLPRDEQNESAQLSVDYRDDPNVPFPVMYYKQPPPSQQPSIFPHEINARSPGIGNSTASLHSTGVDYFPLQLLAPAGDWTRFAVLSSPFQHAPANFTSLTNVAVDVPATLLAEMVKVPKLDPGVRTPHGHTRRCSSKPPAASQSLVPDATRRLPHGRRQTQPPVRRQGGGRGCGS